MACLTGVAASKLPSVYDGSRDSFMDNGHQNMPYKLYGVAIQWDRACRDGDIKECMRLGTAFDNGSGDLRADKRVSVAYYLKACKMGDGEGCARAATIILDGSANYTDVELALTTATAGCKSLNTASSCAAMAIALDKGAGTQSQQAEIGSLLDTACQKGADPACELKARKLFYDTADVKSQAAAIPLFEAGCVLKRAWACTGLTEAFENGLGVTRDHVRAVESARIGCEQGSGARAVACRLHGIYLSAGDQAALNKGEQFLNTSCEIGDTKACVYIGRMALRGKSGVTTTLGEGLYYERRACDLNDADGCAELGLMYQIGNGINADPGVAIALMDKACRLGRLESCKDAKDAVVGDPSIRSAIPAIDPSLTVAEQLLRARKAVEGSDVNTGVNTVVRLMYEQNEYAEWLLGGWLYYGVPGVFDTSRRDDGVILIENAARVGHVDAAIWIGMAYWYGDGVDEDHAKGEKYMLIAADRGSEMAEAIYRSMKNEPARQEMAARQKRMEEAMIDRRSVWQKAMDAWDAALSSGAYANNFAYHPPTYSGASVSSIIDESNWNQRYNYLSGSTTACPTSNPYCH